MSFSSAKQLFNELDEFLTNFFTSHKNAVPGLLLDRAWHHFLLFTKAYNSYCFQKFGAFLHHNPADEEYNIQDDHVLLISSTKNEKCDCSVEMPPPDKQISVIRHQ